MTPVTAALRKLALAATPGPWKMDKSRRVLGPAFDGSYRSICDQVRGGSPESADANAALIVALSPERVLLLLDLIDAAHAMRECDWQNTVARVHAEQAYDALRAKLDEGMPE
jgi:hypothetical protein